MDNALIKAISEAKNKAKKGSELEFIKPNQSGKLLIHTIENVALEAKFPKPAQNFVVMKGEILESQGEGAQSPKTPVKIMYMLSTQPWRLDDLKTDLCSILAVDDKAISQEDFGNLVSDCFYGQEVDTGGLIPPGARDGKSVLAGVVCAFNASIKRDKAGEIKRTKAGDLITQLRFRALPEENDEAAVAARREKLG